MITQGGDNYANRAAVSSSISFQVCSNAGSATDMFIQGCSGRIGLGTTLPKAKLHISGSDSTESSIRQTRAGIKIWDQAIDSSGRLQWGYRTTEAGSRTVTFTLDDNNNVGIGTGAPSQKLHVGSGHILLDNNYEIRQKDSGGTERTIFELDSSNDLNIGGSYAGALKFIGGGSGS